MTAGSGILHQEMPKGDAQGRMHGFQLWANLPASLKMTAPRYQDVAGEGHPRGRPTTTGRRCASSCGEFWGKKGPVEGVAAEPRYLDVSVPPGQRRSACRSRRSHHAFAYVFAGSGTFRDASAPQAVLPNELDGGDARSGADATGNRSLVLFDRGDEVAVQAGDAGHPVPAGLRQADRGAGGVVRTDRDEHRARAAAGRRRAARRHLHQGVTRRPSSLAGRA